FPREGCGLYESDATHLARTGQGKLHLFAHNAHLAVEISRRLNDFRLGHYLLFEMLVFENSKRQSPRTASPGETISPDMNDRDFLHEAHRNLENLCPLHTCGSHHCVRIARGSRMLGFAKVGI